MDKTRWSEKVMVDINALTEEIQGKAFDPGWFMLRQRLEQADAVLAACKAMLAAGSPHAVGCSHKDETCTCHRALAKSAIAMMEQ